MIEILNGSQEGKGPADLRELVVEFASQILLQAGHAADVDAARIKVTECLASGAPRKKWDDMIVAQVCVPSLSSVLIAVLTWRSVPGRRSGRLQRPARGRRPSHAHRRGQEHRCWLRQPLRRPSGWRSGSRPWRWAPDERQRHRRHRRRGSSRSDRRGGVSRCRAGTCTRQ
jgi:hypothetical protein